ncbi:histidinol-phosphate transaminase [Alteromonas oceanisediminis]|uniref:histidinol-phosphate transaminase n=1 Tax=Alteromonas oceanisediminis TaxID=2836180 RepID=UPI001BDA4AD2|nr:histidinol-phosphate transaminase [Alteromonas oceanisediminis]MBT0587480.1 histidinol-phosphate transaminase [Alteromonas oceanisediminis]
MSNLIARLTNPNIATLAPYESARRLYAGGQDWLNANESPYANPYQLDDTKLNRYPACQPVSVVEQYAAYAGVMPQNVLVTRGADEGIELLIRAFCRPGRSSIMICPPTYGMYAISAETCDVSVIKVPQHSDFSLDVDSICQQAGDVSLVFICSPNNPTGTQVAKEDIIRVLEHCADKALVVVDEAYIEFAFSDNWASALQRYPHLVILRTLSKAFALAGLRCGFTLASDAIIQTLLKVIAPYPIPEPVAQIAAQALGEDPIARMREQVDIIETERQRLTDALSAMDEVTLVGAQKANFILFRTPAKDALMRDLVDNGLLIRDQSKQLNLQQCLRISVGTPEQNTRLLSLMRDFFTRGETA